VPASGGVIGCFMRQLPHDQLGGGIPPPGMDIKNHI